MYTTYLLNLVIADETYQLWQEILMINEAEQNWQVINATANDNNIM